MARKKSEVVLWMVRRPEGLVPTTPYDLEELERYRIGSHVKVSIEQQIDDATMRKIHMLISKVARAMGQEPDSLKFYLKIKAGLYRAIDLIDGTHQIVPKSLADLDQPELETFWLQIGEIITTEIIPGSDVTRLMKDPSYYTGEISP